MVCLAQGKDTKKMSRKKEQKLKKLTRQNIWVPILFFIVSALTAVVIVASSAMGMIIYTVQGRFRTAFDNASEISSLIDKRLKAGGNLQDIVAAIGDYTYYTDGLLVTDKDGNVLASFGENTAMLDTAEDFEPMGGHSIYQDTEVLKEFENPDEIFDINEMELAAEIFSNVFGKSNKEDWLNGTTMHMAYWLGTPIGDTDQAVVVKSYITLYNAEVVIIFAVAAAILALLLTPLLFLFINIISNIFTQRKMTRIICTDTITGGKNWFYFENTVAKMLSKRKNFGKTFMLVDFSLMKYRSYCACYGVKYGETLLEQIDQYLCANLQKGEYCALFGKSQFVILLKNSDVNSANDRILRWMNELPGILGYPHAVFHAGVFPIEPVKNDYNGIFRKSADVAQLYNNASAARASIEEQENSAIAVFTPKMLEEQIWNNKVEVNMHAALDNEEFEVYLQPKYNPADNTLAGAEALVRWNSPADGFISPGKFIPIFETNGFITKLDDYMISHVAALQAKWLSEGKAAVPVSVNVSRAHFTQPNLAEHIAELVDVYKIPHSLLEIELTESAFFDDKNALLATINKLKDYGFEVSMDDFGSGYSSLNTLKELPLDILKLDAEFFRGKFEKERGEIVVSEAIHLAKRLNMRIVAEGVEEQEQVDFLTGAGCDMIQGYYYAKPMPADEYAARMEMK